MKPDDNFKKFNDGFHEIGWNREVRLNNMRD